MLGPAVKSFYFVAKETKVQRAYGFADTKEQVDGIFACLTLGFPSQFMLFPPYHAAFAVMVQLFHPECGQEIIIYQS